MGSLSVDEAIATGFDSIYCYRKLTHEREAQLEKFIVDFNLPLLTCDFRQRNFASLTNGEQSLILLLRALVKDPPLLVLDEPFAGMDQGMLNHVKAFLNRTLEGSRRSAIIISHYEEEIPEVFDMGIELEAGNIKSRW